MCGFHAPAGARSGDADRGLPARLRARQPRARGRARLVPRAGPAARGTAGAARRAGERAASAPGPAPDGRARLRNLVVREGRRTGKLQVRLVTTDGRARRRRARGGAVARRSATSLGGRAVDALAQPRRDDRRAARPSSSGARPSCPSGWASSTCASPPRRSSRPTPRWPRCSTGSSPSTPRCEGWERVYDLYCGHRHDRAHARPARRRAVGDRARRARPSPTRSPAPGATRSPTPTSSPATPAWRCPSCSSAPAARTSSSSTRPAPGLSKKVVHRIIEASPKRIVYVSCNPTTLAPNAAELVEAGWALRRVRPVDMFPQTHHIECVALLERESRLRAAMRAATIREQEIVIEEHPDPVPGTGEVLVRVRAAGLNGADMMQRRGLYPAPPGSPAGHPRHGARRRGRRARPGAERFARGRARDGDRRRRRPGRAGRRARAPADAGPRRARLAGGGRPAGGLHDRPRRALHAGASCAPASACSCTAAPAAWARPRSSSARAPARA